MYTQLTTKSSVSISLCQKDLLLVKKCFKICFVTPSQRVKYTSNLKTFLVIYNYRYYSGRIRGTGIEGGERGERVR